jgi:hypothetical protein
VIETCSRFLFGQNEGLDIERHDRDIKNSSFMCLCGELSDALSLFHYLGNQSERNEMSMGKE